MPKRNTKTTFPGRGKPSTPPGSAEDALRIQLSQKLTAILVGHGDELPGTYHTPGINDYKPSKPCSCSR